MVLKNQIPTMAGSHGRRQQTRAARALQELESKRSHLSYTHRKQREQTGSGVVVKSHSLTPVIYFFQ